MNFHYVKLIDNNDNVRVTLPVYNYPPGLNPNIFKREIVFKMEDGVISGMTGAISLWNGDVGRLPWCKKVVEFHTKLGEKVLWERS
jgi:hypothetical protein